MPTAVRSHSKINLGLAIGAPRPDGFHSLLTLYQTLALHDIVRISAHAASNTRISVIANHPRVPLDERNTAWKMVATALQHLDITAEVVVEIDKRLPIQGGLGAGSANAAAALLGLERELDLTLEPQQRQQLAAEVGSDVPLFLCGGVVLGIDRGQRVEALPDLTLAGQAEIPCVVALPHVGVSTPQAFRDWDRRFRNSEVQHAPDEQRSDPDLQQPANRDTIELLSRTYSSVFPREASYSKSGASGIFQDSRPSLDGPEKLHGRSGEQLHPDHIIPSENVHTVDQSRFAIDLAENSLLALVRTGIENDFESVVFPQYPPLREIKRQLMGFEAENAAVYAALSGSGSALFGLYRSTANACAAQRRVQQQGVRAVVTMTLPRIPYWSGMFAE